MRYLLTVALAAALTSSMSSAQENEIPTGPAVGEAVPAFEAVDHLGRKQTRESLQGDKGLLLVISRSADW